MHKSYLIAGAVAAVVTFALFAPGGGDQGARADHPRAAADRGAHRSAGGASSGPVNPSTFFHPAPLRAGQKPPQFVVLSFDGVGWHEKWQYWADLARRVPLRFTGFLTGLYLLDEQHRGAYNAPGHGRGASSLGAWNSTPDVIAEIKDLNAAWQRGDEIGTHYNGHFCSDNRPGGNDWTTAEWNSELDQFFGFLRGYARIDHLPNAPRLQVPADSIRAERTPCLEGQPQQFFPALRQHHFDVDSSVTRRGLYWPVRQDGIWQMGMSTFPLHGTDHFVTTMDYNLWYTQENVSSDVPADRSQRDSDQALGTYLDMYHAAYQGNRAPLFLGNHFESWNNNAYTTALGKFALQVCGQPDTYCVPFRDVVSWLGVQSAATVRRLQSLPPELAAPNTH